MSLATPGLTLVLFFVVAAIRNFVRKADNSDSEPASDYRTMPEAQAGFVLLVAVVSALSLWPASAYIAPGDGLGAVIAMSVAFPIAALIFLLGAKYRAGFAAFGQTAMLMPSLLSLIWSVAVWVT
ncbi:MAG: hypothetical protein GKR98_01880 [Boseongicola sp.]|nr:MAG: hypothetical protein GKR98_01880 [Boseongicola sp.]